MRDIKHSDYGLGASYTKEFSLIGKGNVAEKVRVMDNPGLFSKDFKVVCKNIYIFANGLDTFGDTGCR